MGLGVLGLSLRGLPHRHVKVKRGLDGQDRLRRSKVRLYARIDQSIAEKSGLFGKVLVVHPNPIERNFAAALPAARHGPISSLFDGRVDLVCKTGRFPLIVDPGREFPFELRSQAPQRRRKPVELGLSHASPGKVRSELLGLKAGLSRIGGGFLGFCVGLCRLRLGVGRFSLVGADPLIAVAIQKACGPDRADGPHKRRHGADDQYDVRQPIERIREGL